MLGNLTPVKVCEARERPLCRQALNRLKNTKLQDILDTFSRAAKSPLIMSMKIRSLAILAVATIASAACSDPLAIKASLETVEDRPRVFAITATPPTFPSALSVALRQVVRVDGTDNFDVAFDIDAAGKVILYPPRLIATPLATAREVGIQKVTGTFETVLTAPTGGYISDKPTTLSVGEVAVLQTPRHAGGEVCTFRLSSLIYAKIAVDSVNLANRSIFLHTVVNPNCGFHSLKPGIPAD